MTFQSLAVESASIYLNYLRSKQKGTSDISVRDIMQDKKNPELFSMVLGKHPIAPDSMQIRINGQICRKNEIRPVKYDKKTKKLIVRAISSFIDILKTSDVDDVLISSDLTFLVERVENWYKQFGCMVELPKEKPSVSYVVRDMDKEPSQDQHAAIQGILTYPFTYIWGAPGTGKTRVVLSEAILSYVFESKKVLVTAPTNNALEQTLNGLLPVMDEAGLDYNELVVRLGVPSTEFVDKYPGVCENTAEIHKLSELNDRILDLSNQIREKEELLELFPKYHAFLKSKEALNRFAAEAPEILNSINDLLQEQKYNEAEITRTNGRNVIDSEKIDKLRQEEHQYTERIQVLSNKLKSYNSAFSKKVHSKKIRSLTEELENYVDKEENAHNLVIALQNSINENKKTISDYRDEIEKIKTALYKKKDELLSLSSFHRALNSRIKALDLHLDAFNQLQFEAIVEDLQQRAENKESEFVRFKDLSEAGLSEELVDKRVELEDCLTLKASFESEGGISKRFEKCRVIAVTVDSCLNRLLPNENHEFSHVFLDEAGYCSLIKGCSLFAFGVPVTFLGDHMQLPPICEMTDSEMKQNGYWPVFLWAQSALYAESLYRNDIERVFDDYMQRRDALFDYTKKYDLIKTFRFGPTLASILREEVYSKDFYGADTHETELFYINAKKLQNDEKRTSKNELAAIHKYVEDNPDEDFGIITPYNKQLKRLHNHLNNNQQLVDSIVTVHRSQGREWDTVLFSVVDTTDKYFVNSLNRMSDGKKLINTAVSRARKKLIIVCDYDYWITQKKQLICKMLEKAKPYHM